MKGDQRENAASAFRFERKYTKEDAHPFDEMKWERRDATITDSKGNAVFSQKGIEVPVFWSQTATNIASSKYFRGKLDSPERETSIKQIVSRVAKTITEWGMNGGYFADQKESETYEAELMHILVNQMAAFNSPVWFNVGFEKKPQCSACFINSVEDNMHSILNLAVTEGMLFKYGSGTGTNLSTLRSSREQLSVGGIASGPVSFMKGYDAFAGVIKSGGRTRRAAKMVILNIDHPDVLEFVWCKAKEERKAWSLIEAGYDGRLDGDVYTNIFFQNANNSVRVTDNFMRAVENDGEWRTYAVTEPTRVVDTYKAKEVMKAISEATWQCGDPGLQFDTTINIWHTCPNSERINASNPCGEYNFIDDSACNLASVNLMKFYDPATGKFDVESFKHANAIIVTAQEIIIDNASYPTPAIEKNSHLFRPVGIGYANLGALLMANGLPYDSEEGRNYAAAVSSLQSGYCYYISSLIAKKLGPFKEFEKNKQPMLNVIDKHRKHAHKIGSQGVPSDLLNEAKTCWDATYDSGNKDGFRNAQISVIAPTGTIGLMMDCDTTGIEPEIALIKYKWLVGGGMIKFVNNTVPLALRKLGYSNDQIDLILRYLDEHGTIEGAPQLKEEHLPVFDCAFKPAKGKRFIHHMGHIHMMAAVQPFISGAISKTVNMQKESSVEDVADAYAQSWKLGLKSIAIYRDGSKRTQPLTLSKQADTKIADQQKEKEIVIVNKPIRKRLQAERRAITHRFDIGGHEGYITVGLYDDGLPGEIFITMSKEGSTISGMMDAFATSISIALQYGVPLRTLVKKFVHTRYEPSGMTSNPRIRIAKSITDYLFRWMAIKFLSKEDQIEVGINMDLDQTLLEEVSNGALTPASGLGQAKVAKDRDMEFIDNAQLPVQPSGSSGPYSSSSTSSANTKFAFDNSEDAPACPSCGSIMVRSASCYKCLNCGNTSGCS